MKEFHLRKKGSTIGKIYSENESDFYAKIYVENSDIGRIKEGQEVKLEIAAYPSMEYGYFKLNVLNSEFATYKGKVEGERNLI